MYKCEASQCQSRTTYLSLLNEGLLSAFSEASRSPGSCLLATRAAKTQPTYMQFHVFDSMLNLNQIKSKLNQKPQAVLSGDSMILYQH